MALGLAEQGSSYPLAAYNFRVTLGGVSMRFAKVSGLAREYKTLTYRDGLSFREGEGIVRYHVAGWGTLTLEQGTVAGSRGLVDWLEKGDPRPMEVCLCDAQGEPALVWKIASALPVKLSAPSLDAKTNEAAIDTLEVKASGIAIAAP